MKKIGLFAVVLVGFALGGCSEGVMEPVVTWDGVAGEVVLSEDSDLGTLQETTPIIQILEPEDGEVIFFDFVNPSNNQRDVSVRVTREDGEAANAGLCGMRNLVVTVNGVTIGSEATSASARLASADGSTCPTTTADFGPYVWDFNTTGVDTYLIRASVLIVAGQNEHDDEITVEVVEEETVTVSYRAAPAVAADLLKEAEIDPRYGSGRTGGNHIADVALEMTMTEGTDFQGVAKDDVDAYRCQVATFLNEKDPAAAVSLASCPIS